MAAHLYPLMRTVDFDPFELINAAIGVDGGCFEHIALQFHAPKQCRTGRCGKKQHKTHNKGHHHFQ